MWANVRLNDKLTVRVCGESDTVVIRGVFVVPAGSNQLRPSVMRR